MVKVLEGVVALTILRDEWLNTYKRKGRRVGGAEMNSVRLLFAEMGDLLARGGIYEVYMWEVALGVVVAAGRIPFPALNPMGCQQ